MLNYDEYRTDCYFYAEDHDMGATIPCCDYHQQYGHCPCSTSCKKYIEKSEVAKMIKQYVDRRSENANDTKEL